MVKYLGSKLEFSHPCYSNTVLAYSNFNYSVVLKTKHRSYNNLWITMIQVLQSWSGIMLYKCDWISENQPLCGFRKINHSVTFHTLNTYCWNKLLHSTNQHYRELNVRLYNELPATLWNILIATSVLLWQQGKVLGSIYFRPDKVVDFSKSRHKCTAQTAGLLLIAVCRIPL